MSQRTLFTEKLPSRTSDGNPTLRFVVRGDEILLFLGRTGRGQGRGSGATQRVPNTPPLRLFLSRTKDGRVESPRVFVHFSDKTLSSHSRPNSEVPLRSPPPSPILPRPHVRDGVSVVRSVRRCPVERLRFGPEFGVSRRQRPYPPPVGGRPVPWGQTLGEPRRVPSRYSHGILRRGSRRPT